MPTRYSWPPLFYSPFWYKYIPFEINCVGCYTFLKYLGSLVYILAIVPTLLSFWRLIRVAGRTLQLFSLNTLAKVDHRRTVASTLFLLAFDQGTVGRIKKYLL